MSYVRDQNLDSFVRHLALDPEREEILKLLDADVKRLQDAGRLWVDPSQNEAIESDRGGGSFQQRAHDHS